jgi:hypothetical protein
MKKGEWRVEKGEKIKSRNSMPEGPSRKRKFTENGLNGCQRKVKRRILG